MLVIKSGLKCCYHRNQKEDEVENEKAEKRNGGKKDFYKVLRINTDRVQRGVVFEELKNEMKKNPEPC